MPTSASTRRTPEPIDDSERIFTRPSWAGAGHVGAAAQLAGVVADLDDPDLARRTSRRRAPSRRSGAPPPALVTKACTSRSASSTSLTCCSTSVQHARRHPGRGVEVEPQPARRVQRTRLGRRLAEEVAHRLVHQVGGGVRAGDRPPPGHVDLGVAGLAGAHLAADHPRPVHDQARHRLLHVEHLDLPAADGDQALVGLLATALGVERGRVEHQLDGVALDRRADRRAAGAAAPAPVDSRVTSV